MKPKVTFLIGSDSLAALGPYLNSIKLLSTNGYSVTVFSLYNKTLEYGTISQEYQDCFLHKSIDFSPILKMPLYLLRIISYLKRKWGISKKIYGPYTLKHFYEQMFYLLYSYKKIDKGNNILIATDPYNLFLSLIINKMFGNNYIYFEQELFHSNDIRSCIQKFMKYLERKSNIKAFCTVEFDEYRAQLIRVDNHLNDNLIIVIPNAPIGDARMERKYIFNKKFNIDKEKKIALYTGGIATYNYLYEIIESATQWPDNVVLVLHCYGSKRQVEELNQLIKRYNKEIYISSEWVANDEITDIYSSSDIGFALYGDQDINHKYTGLSSGRLFNFMKSSIPIITNNTPINLEVIANRGCGICINNSSEINYAVSEILRNEQIYKCNCYENFSNYNFEKHHKKLISVIENARDKQSLKVDD